MKGLLPLLAALLLAACLPGGGGDDADDPVTLTVRAAPDDLEVPVPQDAEAAEVDALSQDDAADVDASLEDDTEPTAASEPDAPVQIQPPEPPASPAQLKCVADGGRWARAGEVGYVCYQTPRDANKFCRSSDDCEGACLAKSRTCAPITPLMGCHEILNRSGTRSTQCRNF
ncbi:hypothetical protein ILP92_11835 [Maribius pontilimi]|uniref:PAN domain-containing protein n=1 Tax=Palleronia pontilimi TaxID=1964209 RepID=A0A934IID4_9RHOB|nr:hypothetical protein [Palleronia pontilimi]MBJ3763436.1 hypothetical protein [Palleronia pontilimi]